MNTQSSLSTFLFSCTTSGTESEKPADPGKSIVEITQKQLKEKNFQYLVPLRHSKRIVATILTSINIPEKVLLGVNREVPH